MKYLRRQHMPMGLVVLLDILVIGALMLSFAFFHHVMPAMVSQQELNNRPSEPPEPPVSSTPSDPSDASDPTDASETESTEPSTEPDLRTAWQKKFEEHFTEDVVLTENSYSSPEVSITVETVVTGEGSKQLTYYVADIYIASMDNFKTYTPHGSMTYFDTQPAVEMAEESDAILAISGDFLTYQKTGFLLRNGEPYATTHNRNSICVLFPDGTMETYVGGTYNMQEIQDRNPMQVWSFGPVLLDSEGNARSSYEVSEVVNYPNPRSAIGYYEPGHYCFVVVDGRQKHSRGVKVEELAQIFDDLGCAAAYNLDGGGTAVMVFDGEIFSKQSNGGRELGDILLITDSGFYKEADQ